MPRPTRPCAPAPLGPAVAAPVPVLSRILRPSIRPLRPRFCNPIPLLRSPDQTSRAAPRSLSPSFELHSLSLTLFVALSS